VAVLSHNFWERHFRSDPTILGQSLRNNNTRLTVVGITSKDFGGTRVEIPDIWVPMAMQATLMGSDSLSNGGSWWLDVVGRREMHSAAVSKLARRPVRSSVWSRTHGAPLWVKPSNRLSICRCFDPEWSKIHRRLGRQTFSI